MTPLDCQKTWIPQNIQKGEIPGEGYSYSLYPPMKISETFYLPCLNGGIFERKIR
jgi:hypothetical protein